MARSRKSSTLDDLLFIATKLPWKISLLPAVIAYLGFHYLATSVADPGLAGQVGSNLGASVVAASVRHTLIVVFATYLQYIVPAVFCIGAGLSFRDKPPRAGSDYDDQGISANPKAPTCPACNSVMVRRTAQKGANAGSSFWGCSQYPKCRGTRQA